MTTTEEVGSKITCTVPRFGVRVDGRWESGYEDYLHHSKNLVGDLASSPLARILPRGFTDFPETARVSRDRTRGATPRRGVKPRLG